MKSPLKKEVLIPFGADFKNSYFTKQTPEQSAQIPKERIVQHFYEKKIKFIDVYQDAKHERFFLGQKPNGELIPFVFTGKNLSEEFKENSFSVIEHQRWPYKLEEFQDSKPMKEISILNLNKDHWLKSPYSGVLRFYNLSSGKIITQAGPQYKYEFVQIGEEYFLHNYDSYTSRNISVITSLSTGKSCKFFLRNVDFFDSGIPHVFFAEIKQEKVADIYYVDFSNAFTSLLTCTVEDRSFWNTFTWRLSAVSVLPFGDSLPGFLSIYICFSRYKKIPWLFGLEKFVGNEEKEKFLIVPTKSSHPEDHVIIIKDEQEVVVICQTEKNLYLSFQDQEDKYYLIVFSKNGETHWTKMSTRGPFIKRKEIISGFYAFYGAWGTPEGSITFFDFRSGHVRESELIVGVEKIRMSQGSEYPVLEFIDGRTAPVIYSPDSNPKISVGQVSFPKLI